MDTIFKNNLTMVSKYLIDLPIPTYLTSYNGYWWNGDQMAVPTDVSIRKAILYEFHDAPYSGHVGINETEAAVWILSPTSHARRRETMVA